MQTVEMEKEEKELHLSQYLKEAGVK